MTGVATAIGVGVAGIAAGAYESSQATSAQKSAAQSAANTQNSMFNYVAGQEQPYVQQGQAADAALGQFYGLPGQSGGAASTPNYNQILSSLPGYQFQLQQGSLATTRDLAAQGLLQSGAAGKELQQYGQGLAQSYAGQYTQGLTGLAQLGQAGASQQAASGMNAANNISSSQIYAGNAAAQGAYGTANAVNQGIGQGLGTYGMYSAYQNNVYGGGGSPSSAYYNYGGAGAGATYAGGDDYVPLP